LLGFSHQENGIMERFQTLASMRVAGFVDILGR